MQRTPFFFLIVEVELYFCCCCLLLVLSLAHLTHVFTTSIIVLNDQWSFLFLFSSQLFLQEKKHGIMQDYSITNDPIFFFFLISANKRLISGLNFLDMSLVSSVASSSHSTHIYTCLLSVVL